MSASKRIISPRESAPVANNVLPSRLGTGLQKCSTRWVSQEHASKKVNEIDASQVKDGDRVIPKGTWEKKGVFHATLISKRLSHSA